MHSVFNLSSLLAVLTCAGVMAAPRPVCDDKAAFFLAGDSTTAQQATSGGGWGNGFLTTITNGSFGMNYGHNGATTVSFRNGGDWARVLAKVNQSKALDYKPFVTIQFGHNDQKAAANISLERFSANLEQMVLDVQAAGGTPILVTSLTRRNFNSSGLAIENLAPQANATIVVAKNMNVPYIDLNRASTDYVNAIGFNASSTYNLIPTDYTHLNAHGSMLFGNMVSILIGKALKNGNQWTKPNSTIAKAIRQGEYIFPSLPTTTWTNTTAPGEFSY